MKARTSLVVVLTIATAMAQDEPERMPPWIVAEAALRPDAQPIHASALLPEQAWSGRSVGTLVDAFRQIPGAFLQESFGGFEPPRVSIRGSGVQSAPSSRGVTLLLNELPLGLADGSFNSALIDPLLTEQIAVQRGIDAWRVAPAVAGGALDFRRASQNPLAPAGRMEAGSFGALRATASAGGLALSHAQLRGFREHSGQARTALFGVAQRKIAANAILTADVYHARARYDVPGPLTLAAAFANPRTVSADVRRDLPARRAELTRMAGTFARRDAETDFEVGAALARTGDDFRQLQANGVTWSRSDDVSVRARYARRFSLASMPHQWSLLATGARGWRDQRRFLNNAGQRGERFAHDGLFPTTLTLHVEDHVALAPRLVASLGVARVAADRRIADRSGTLSTRNVDSHSTVPAASLRWTVAREAAVYLSASTAVEPATFDDLLVVAGAPPNLVRRTQSLLTQRARTVEVGARGRQGSVSWDVAIYHAAWHNEVLRLADARGVPRGAVNASPTTHEGIEASARWVVCAQPRRVTLSATTGWTQFRFDGDSVYGRNRLAGIPPHFGSAEMTVDLTRDVFVAISGDWTAGATRVDHAGRLAYGGAARTHARVGWRSARHWLCFVEVRNLFDRAGIASTAGVLDIARDARATAIFLPATGRAISFGSEWRW